MTRFTVILACFFLFPRLSFATSGSQIEIEQAWARPTAGAAANGAAYFTLKNAGKTDDTLISVETRVAAKAEMHESKMEGQVMKMLPLTEVLVPAGGTVEFKPGGKHVMLLGLKAPLTEGQSFTLTFKFKSAGARDAKIDVENPKAGAMAPAGSTGGMRGMDMSR